MCTGGGGLVGWGKLDVLSTNVHRLLWIGNLFYTYVVNLI
jgi:hypothetical protein